MQAELVNGKGPFEVLSLAPLIASQIDLELDVSRTGVPPCHCLLAIARCMPLFSKPRA